MKKAWIVAAAIVFAVSAVGCKDKCIKACEHVAECAGESKDDCDTKCKDVEGMDKKDAKDAAKCVLDLSCSELTDPMSTKFEECMTN